MDKSRQTLSQPGDPGVVEISYKPHRPTQLGHAPSLQAPAAGPSLRRTHPRAGTLADRRESGKVTHVVLQSQFRASVGVRRAALRQFPLRDNEGTASGLWTRPNASGKLTGNTC